MVILINHTTIFTAKFSDSGRFFLYIFMLSDVQYLGLTMYKENDKFTKECQQKQ